MDEIELAPVQHAELDDKHKMGLDASSDRADVLPSLNKSFDAEAPFVLTQRKKNIYGVAACIALFIAGWQDGSAGPLIPSLQALFNVSAQATLAVSYAELTTALQVNYTIISMIFVCGFVGFAGAGFLNMYLTDRLGLGRVFALGALIQVAGYALQFWYPPFAVFVSARDADRMRFSSSRAEPLAEHQLLRHWFRRLGTGRSGQQPREPILLARDEDAVSACSVWCVAPLLSGNPC